MPSTFKRVTAHLTGQTAASYKVAVGAKISSKLLHEVADVPADNLEKLLSSIDAGGRSLFVVESGNGDTFESAPSVKPLFLNPVGMTEADQSMVTALLQKYLSSMQRYVDVEDKTKDAPSYVGRSARLYVFGQRAVIVMAKPKDYAILLEDADSQLGKLDKLAHQLGRDPVIDGLAGKEVFALDIKDRALKAEKARQPYALIKFDIDRFKSINDDYSHDEADQVLRQVARTVKREFPHYSFGRTGGDEFLIFVPDCNNAEVAAALAEQLRNKIKETPFTVKTAQGQQKLTATLSLGAAVFNPALDERRPSLDIVSYHADRAMSKAKGGGRALWSLHGDSVWYVHETGSLREHHSATLKTLSREKEPLATTFVPNDIARLVINDLVTKFKNGEDAARLEGQDQNDPAVKYREQNIRSAATLIQAGARGLLATDQREGIFLPIRIQDTNRVKVFEGEPDIIRSTQQRYMNLYTANPPTNPSLRQQRGFLRALRTGAKVLEKQGCTAVAKDIQNYVKLALSHLTENTATPPSYTPKEQVLALH